MSMEWGAICGIAGLLCVIKGIIAKMMTLVYAAEVRGADLCKISNPLSEQRACVPLFTEGKL